MLKKAHSYHKYFARVLTTLGLFLLSQVLLASGNAYNDPVPQVLLGLVIMFAGAKIGGLLAGKLSQPVVLGELTAGILLGNLTLFGLADLTFIKNSEIFEIMAGIGVVLLLFEVGLESSIDELLKVGVSSLIVAIIGVVIPFFLGYGISSQLLSGESVYVHAFVGATLCATSVGITARVLRDLGKIHLNESKIILGAAVIDDVLGLIILAVISSLIMSVDQGGTEKTALMPLLMIALKAIGFLLGALIIGTKIAPSLFRFGARIRVEGMLLALSLSFCFLLSYLADFFGLAAIVGSFAAGLIIDGTGFARFFGEDEPSIEHLILPISKFFVPLFFVNMGMQVSLELFMSSEVIVLGLALSLGAIIGKQVCGLGVLPARNDKPINRLLIGLGMIPRGEVGLIFAMYGTSLTIAGRPVINASLYAAIVMMIVITTMLTPPAIKWCLGRPNKSSKISHAEQEPS